MSPARWGSRLASIQSTSGTPRSATQKKLWHLERGISTRSTSRTSKPSRATSASRSTRKLVTIAFSLSDPALPQTWTCCRCWTTQIAKQAKPRNWPASDRRLRSAWASSLKSSACLVLWAQRCLPQQRTATRPPLLPQSGTIGFPTGYSRSCRSRSRYKLYTRCSAGVQFPRHNRRQFFTEAARDPITPDLVAMVQRS